MMFFSLFSLPYPDTVVPYSTCQVLLMYALLQPDKICTHEFRLNHRALSCLVKTKAVFTRRLELKSWGARISRWTPLPRHAYVVRVCRDGARSLRSRGTVLLDSLFV